MAEPRFIAIHADATGEGAFEIERGIIEAAGGELRITRGRGEDELVANLKDADAVLVSAAPITRGVIERLPKLKLLVRYGVGLDTLDIPAATDHGVVVTHFPDFCQPEVANHAIMLLLGSAKQLMPLDRAVRRGRWRPGALTHIPHITDQVLGLVGFGNIGRAVAQRAHGFDLHVIAYDPYLADDDFTQRGVERVPTLEALLERADFVSLHTPLTPETHYMMSAAQFRRMKPTAFVINTSRGPVIDEAALIEALHSGEIAGAGLDVFEREPLSGDSPLGTMEHVLFTPHSASYSDRAFEALKHRVGEACVDVLVRGRWPEFVPNRAEVKPRVELS